MPRVYTRKYQAELEDLVYFLCEYPELRHHLTPAQREQIEGRRQQLINWLWRQMGRKDEPPVLKEDLSLVGGDEVGHPLGSTPPLMIIDLYEEWRANETGRNPGAKAKARLIKKFGFKTEDAVNKYLQRARKLRDKKHKAALRDLSDDDIPF